MFTKEIYALKNKSEDGTQHFGFIIFNDEKPFIRQWHMPGVSGHVFMTEEEANEYGAEMLDSFENEENLPPLMQF